jgi:hypothetical protein
MNHQTWRNNPQFFLIVDKTIRVLITQEQLGNEENTSMGFYVTQTTRNQVVILEPDQILVQTTFQIARSGINLN